MVPDAPFIAITGTNGKSTTTALIAHLLAADRPRGRAWRQHRQGDPVARAAAHRPLPRHRVLVLPDRPRPVAQSVDRRAPQRLARSPRSPRHHGRLRPHQGAAGRASRETAVIAVDDELVPGDRRSRRRAAAARVIRVSTRRPLADGVYAEGTDILAAANGASARIASLAGIHDAARHPQRPERRRRRRASCAPSASATPRSTAA